MGQSNNVPYITMSSANSANIPSPTPSSFTIDMDIAKLLPTQPQVETPVVHKQDCLSIPSEIVATSKTFSELQLSPRSVCTALEGHSSPGQEELLHITQGLAGVVQKMKRSVAATTNSWKYSNSEERLWQSVRQMWLALKRPTL